MTPEQINEMAQAMGHECWPEFLCWCEDNGLSESDKWVDLEPWFNCFSSGWANGVFSAREPG